MALISFPEEPFFLFVNFPFGFLGRSYRRDLYLSLLSFCFSYISFSLFPLLKEIQPFRPPSFLPEANTKSPPSPSKIPPPTLWSLTPPFFPLGQPPLMRFANRPAFCTSHFVFLRSADFYFPVAWGHDGFPRAPPLSYDLADLSPLKAFQAPLWLNHKCPPELLAVFFIEVLSLRREGPPMSLPCEVKAPS